ARVPDTQGPVVAGRGQIPAVRAERHAVDAATLMGQLIEFLPRPGIQYWYHPFHVRQGEAPAIRAIDHLRQVEGRDFAGEDALVGPQVPDRDESIVSAGSQVSLVGTEGHALHRMALL